MLRSEGKGSPALEILKQTNLFVPGGMEQEPCQYNSRCSRKPAVGDSSGKNWVGLQESRHVDRDSRQAPGLAEDGWQLGNRGRQAITLKGLG